ncbi:Uncharacterised protein [Bordetella pertussis]|nr:Uncharacterised protein [Bordetella pertussis]
MRHAKAGDARRRRELTPCLKLPAFSPPTFRRRLTVSEGSALRSAYRLRKSSPPSRTSRVEARPGPGALLTRLTMPPWLPRPYRTPAGPLSTSMRSMLCRSRTYWLSSRTPSR